MTGGFKEGDNTDPIKTFPEYLERDVSNIIAQCSKKNNNGEYIIGDLSILTIELMEYILENYEMGNTSKNLP